MNTIPNYTELKDSFQRSTVARTQEAVLKSLNEEYEKAKSSITDTNDLRVLRSMMIRIGTLNNPRGRNPKRKNVETTEKVEDVEMSEN